MEVLVQELPYHIPFGARRTPHQCMLLFFHKGASLDHTELMGLAIQLYDVYGESILGFFSKKALAGEHIALVCPTLVST
jgi:hypothetical protein